MKRAFLVEVTVQVNIMAKTKKQAEELGYKVVQGELGPHRISNITHVDVIWDEEEAK